MHDKTLAQLSAGLAAGDFSSVELTRHFLERIEAVDGHLNSYITVTGKRAMAAAADADARLRRRAPPPVRGTHRPQGHLLH